MGNTSLTEGGRGMDWMGEEDEREGGGIRVGQGYVRKERMCYDRMCYDSVCYDRMCHHLNTNEESSHSVFGIDVVTDRGNAFFLTRTCFLGACRLIR